MKNPRKFIVKYSTITLGTVITGIALNLFLIPNQLAVGGVSGLSTALNHVIPVSIGVIAVVINVPLFILGVIYEGRSFGIKTVYATLMLSVFIDVFSFLPCAVGDMLLASVFGGVMSGIGYGMVLQRGATTGGSDIIAKLINGKYRHISMGSLLFGIDIVVIVIASLIFRNIYTGLYSVIALFMSSKMIDLMIEGVNFAKLAFIISAKNKEIGHMITADLNRGATSLEGRGVYTDTEKNVIICTLKRNEITKLKRLIWIIDEKAFVIITDAKEVLGEGFIQN